MFLIDEKKRKRLLDDRLHPIRRKSASVLSRQERQPVVSQTIYCPSRRALRTDDERVYRAIKTDKDDGGKMKPLNEKIYFDVWMVVVGALAGVILVCALAFPPFSVDQKRFCQSNPDQCVCEELNYYTDDSDNQAFPPASMNYPSIEECSKFRKKTSE